ncbi:hypothetical protein CYL18_04570 [Pradoshia eiseniae]|uniref:Uncharacterized protein n=1 Tax=Pradoshia eiseniae TaxID=2064768 RepID=A0A2S7N4Z4_9BACI|nr:hypothetical protein [Pradoshia eiseniae]PQD97152.1 hypothetical protein CYL18_04570 [Pradoshia eiseniae]
MLQQIKIANWLVEADISKTREFYNKGISVCDCLDCKNFVEACKHLDTSVAIFFNNLGINPAMPANLSIFPTKETMIKQYIGNYHFVGKVLKGEFNTFENAFEIKSFMFDFSDDLAFVPEDFPDPVLQLDFDAEIPWVLDEHPDEI